jgi:hypothetical protein
MDSKPPPLSRERVLEIVAEKLGAMHGEWSLQPGPLLKGPGSLGVRVAEQQHTDNFRHVDLEFLLNVDRPADTSLIDCTTGLAAEPEQAMRQAVGAWADTTASVALELMEREGRLASHFPPHASEGFPGWHSIIGGVTGWGLDPRSALKRQWFVDAMPWTTLAPVIAAGLDRPYLNGVRLFVGQGGEFQTCEVQINGRLHGPSTLALAALDWPRTEKMSTARMFLLLVHPATDEDAQRAARS